MSKSLGGGFITIFAILALAIVLLQTHDNSHDIQ